jgi:hypothetical protein
LHILVIRQDKTASNFSNEADWRQAGERAAFVDEMGLIE